MRHIVEGYSLQLLDPHDDDEVVPYQAVYDGIVATSEDIDKLVDRIRWTHEQGSKVIVAIFEPES